MKSLLATATNCYKKRYNIYYNRVKRRQWPLGNAFYAPIIFCYTALMTSQNVGWIKQLIT